MALGLRVQEELLLLLLLVVVVEVVQTGWKWLRGRARWSAVLTPAAGEIGQTLEVGMQRQCGYSARHGFCPAI